MSNETHKALTYDLKPCGDIKSLLLGIAKRERWENGKRSGEYFIDEEGRTQIDLDVKLTEILDDTPRSTQTRIRCWATETEYKQLLELLDTRVKLIGLSATPWSSRSGSGWSIACSKVVADTSSKPSA